MSWRLVAGAPQADHGLGDCRQVRDCPSQKGMTDADP